MLFILSITHIEASSWYDGGVFLMWLYWIPGQDLASVGVKYLNSWRFSRIASFFLVAKLMKVSLCEAAGAESDNSKMEQIILWKFCIQKL